MKAVVIGASAGGIEALSVLLPALPLGFAPAVVVVLHLPRNRESLLTEVFGAKCALPVREATDKEPIAAGTIYFAPPDYHLLIEAGERFALSTEAPVNFSRPSIDVTFEAAAAVWGAQVAGVLLTGASSDGALGLRAIKRSGGATFVQSPATARSPEMPRAAIASGGAEFVLGLDELVAALLRSGRIESGRIEGGA